MVALSAVLLNCFIIGLPTYGFHIFIQLLMSTKPEIALSNLQYVSFVLFFG